MAEQMTPEQPRWYTKPTEVILGIERSEKDPLGEEVAILVRINGLSVSALVPISTVDEARRLVHGWKVGEFEGDVLVTFPPSSKGRTILRVKPNALKELVR